MELTPENHERVMQLVADTKKLIMRNVSSGDWVWRDRDEIDNPDSLHKGYPTAWAAMVDAVEPYLEVDENG